MCTIQELLHHIDDRLLAAKTLRHLEDRNATNVLPIQKWAYHKALRNEYTVTVIANA